MQLPEWAGRLRLVTPRLIRDLHAHGIAIQVWTVNDPADMDRYLKAGVDYLTTNEPEILLEKVK